MTHRSKGKGPLTDKKFRSFLKESGNQNNRDKLIEYYFGVVFLTSLFFFSPEVLQE